MKVIVALKSSTNVLCLGTSTYPILINWRKRQENYWRILKLIWVDRCKAGNCGQVLCTGPTGWTGMGNINMYMFFNHPVFYFRIEVIDKCISSCTVSLHSFPQITTPLLYSFLRAYGYQFSKQDHIMLVKLLFELVTIPNLEPPLLQSWALILSRLLK